MQAPCSICNRPASFEAENRRTGKVVFVCDAAECRAALDHLAQEPVSRANYTDVFDVGVSPEQLKFVDTPAEALVIANYGGKHMLPLLLYDDNHAPVGFAMLRLFQPDDPSTIGISRFLISTEHQGRGLGKRHLVQLLAFIQQTYRPTAIVLSVHNEALAAHTLYKSVGFNDVEGRVSTPNHTDMILFPERRREQVQSRIGRQVPFCNAAGPIKIKAERPIENNRQQLDRAATIPIQSVEIRNAQFLWMLRADRQTPIELHMQYIDVRLSIGAQHPQKLRIADLDRLDGN